VQSAEDLDRPEDETKKNRVLELPAIADAPAAARSR
jgi:hypothetical protein